MNVAWRRQIVLPLIAAAITATTDFGYAALIAQQSATPPDPGVVPFIFAYIAGIAVLALIGAVSIARGRTTMARIVLAAAAAGSGALGFLGIFSIGLPLIVAAILLGIATLGGTPERRLAMGRIAPLAGAFAAVCVLIGGLTFSGAFF